MRERELRQTETGRQREGRKENLTERKGIGMEGGVEIERDRQRETQRERERQTDRQTDR